MPALERIAIDGYKSIRTAEIELHNLNLLIGANGAGKSNFIGAFRFLHELVNGQLSLHVGRAGGVDTFLYFGQKTTEQLILHVDFAPELAERANSYECHLVPSQEDTFVFSNEIAYFHDRRKDPNPSAYPLGSGHNESLLKNSAPGNQVARFVNQAMKSWRIYHFHDTSETARVKQTVDIDDNRFLRPDASNLAAYLYLLQETEPLAYRNIVGAIRLIAPFFRDFILRPSPLNPDKIRLEWQDQNDPDAYFNAHSLSDGTLRFMSLATLLLQPANRLPSTILLDEPELGLHPYAITILASLLQKAAEQTQVIVSTQSVTLVNHFTPEDIIVVDSVDGQSTFRRLAEGNIATWLDEYGLGDLWEKNVLGGRPA